MPKGIYIHKPDCGCAACRSKRGEYSGENNPNYGVIHKLGCKCVSCVAKRGEPHKLDCKCGPCRNKRGEPHKPDCKCLGCSSKRGDPHKPGCQCGRCKMERGEYRGENHPLFGIKRPDMTGENHPMFGTKRPDTAERNRKNCGENSPVFGTHRTPEENEKNSISHRGDKNGMFDKKHKPESLEKMAIGKARRWASGEPTIIEKTVMIFLEELGLLYEFQKPIKRYIADFFLPDYNLIIEADGDYWHNRPGAKVYDALKDLIYRGLGIKVVRLTEALINGDTDVCLELIREGCLG